MFHFEEFRVYGVGERLWLGWGIKSFNLLGFLLVSYLVKPSILVVTRKFYFLIEQTESFQFSTNTYKKRSFFLKG